MTRVIDPSSYAFDIMTPDNPDTVIVATPAMSGFDLYCNLGALIGIWCGWSLIDVAHFVTKLMRNAAVTTFAASLIYAIPFPITFATSLAL